MNALQFSFLGYAMRLGQPVYLWGLLAVLFFLALALLAVRARKRRLATLVDPVLLPRVAPGASPARAGTRQVLFALALGLLVLALAEPQCGSRTELAKRQGIDLVVAIDSSKSMLARDVKPSRLERAKLELAELLDRMKGDRVGIVTFAGDAFTQCPLTNDYAAAKMFLRAIDPNAMPLQGTNIARALEESKQLLVDAERGAKARAIVLLTDGEDTMGEGTPKLLDELEQLGIRVYTVGIGSATGEPIPEVDEKGNLAGYKKDKGGNIVVSRLDEKGLEAIADKTGGKYFHALGGVAVRDVADELDRLDKTEFETRLTVKFDERFQYVAFPGLVLLLIGAAIRPGRRTA